MSKLLQSRCEDTLKWGHKVETFHRSIFTECWGYLHTRVWRGAAVFAAVLVVFTAVCSMKHADKHMLLHSCCPQPQQSTEILSQSAGNWISNVLLTSECIWQQQMSLTLSLLKLASCSLVLTCSCRVTGLCWMRSSFPGVRGHLWLSSKNMT